MKWAGSAFVHADAARDSHDYHRAIVLYRRGLKVAPFAWSYRVQLGHAFKEIGELGKAEVEYLRALRAAPYDADLHVQLGHLSRLQEYNSQAAIHYGRALYFGSTDAHALDFLGKVHAGSSDLVWRHPPPSSDNPAARQSLASLLATETERARLLAEAAPTGTLAQLILRHVNP